MVDVKELKELCQDFKVLYVEDNASIQSVMSQYLEKAWWRINSNQ